MLRRLEATVRHQGDVAIIDLRGEINSFAEDALNAASTEPLKDDAETVLLNFKDVDYINSTGIALIVTLLARARKTGSRVLASGLSDHFQEIFRITRLTDFMSLSRMKTAPLRISRSPPNELRPSSRRGEK